ncbi:MAG: glycosyltransferase family 4 protein [Candidatus Zixiibacteriota bacterium]|nr:MAG: glycosyltransferase family 4 protein [candidate division Zixibacteria bacterium]
MEESAAINTGTRDEPRVVGKPKILLLTSSRCQGTCYQRAYKLAEALRADGWSADVIVHNRSEPSSGIRLRSIVSRWHHIRRLVGMIPRYDIIHISADASVLFYSFVGPVVMLSKFFARKVIVNFAPVNLDDFLARWGRLANAFMRVADRLQVDSVYMAAIYSHHHLKADVPTAMFDAAAVPFRAIERLQPKILTDRPLTRDNNVACLIRAFKFVKEKYPRSELVIAGDGPQRPALEMMIKTEHIYGVTFAPAESLSEADRLFDEAEVYVNSSSYDNLPESILRAFAAGLPVVTTDAGAIEQLVIDRVNGMVVSVNDHVAMAERIIELIEKPELIGQFAKHARTDVEQFGWDKVGKTWRHFYRSVMAD